MGCSQLERPYRTHIYGINLLTKIYNVQDHENFTIKLKPIQISNLSEELPAILFIIVPFLSSFLNRLHIVVIIGQQRKRQIEHFQPRELFFCDSLVDRWKVMGMCRSTFPSQSSIHGGIGTLQFETNTKHSLIMLGVSGLDDGGLALNKDNHTFERSRAD